MEIAILGIAIATGSTAVVCYLAWVCPRVKFAPTVDRQIVNDKLARARYHRNCLEAMHLDLCERLCVEPDSCGGDAVRQAVFSGRAWSDVMAELEKLDRWDHEDAIQ